MHPKISRIIPVYNVEPYIADCLQSVMRQTYKGEMECIIVDDCGIDNSIPVAEQLINSYRGPIEFKVLHHEHNRGLSAARNTGMDAACGDYIYFIDSDDWISDDCIEKQTAPLSENEYDLIISDYSTFGGERTSTLLLTRGSINRQSDIIEAVCSQQVYVMAWNKLVSSSIIKKSKVRFLEGVVHEDMAWSFDLACVMNKMYVIPEVTYIYRMRPNSIIGLGKNKGKVDEGVLSYAQVLMHVISSAKKHNVKDDAFDAYVLYLFDTIAYLAFFNGLKWKEIYNKIRNQYQYSIKIKPLTYYNFKTFLKQLHWAFCPRFG